MPNDKEPKFLKLTPPMGVQTATDPNDSQASARLGTNPRIDTTQLLQAALLSLPPGAYKWLFGLVASMASIFALSTTLQSIWRSPETLQVVQSAQIQMETARVKDHEQVEQLKRQVDGLQGAVEGLDKQVDKFDGKLDRLLQK